jgi:N-acetylglucosaminyldiphosphoundecaprenol N-acetyl-beta-D-mannosaminyltransferase
MFDTVSILGTRVAAISRESAAEIVDTWACNAERAYAVGAADVHVITRARHEEEYGSLIRNFDMVLPDGMPLVWEINRMVSGEKRLSRRVSGADLMRLVLSSHHHAGRKSHFLLGGSPRLLEDLERVIGQQFPHANVGGSYSPPYGTWPEDELQRICQKISESGATHIWVALGCPKQERWIGENIKTLPPGVYFAVGAAFAFLAGHVKRAPDFFQKNGLEWFYRICKEPRRLWKRYFVYNSLYIYYWVRTQMADPE